MKNKWVNSVAVLVIMLFASCSRNEVISIPVEKLTREGYFTLLESNEKGRYGPVIIFPEMHNSRLIQAEIGWALDVLLEICGMNTIALEGMFEGETMSGEKLRYETDEQKYTVLLTQLETGEIKAPEFMYLAKDSLVFGIENESEYAFTRPDEAWKAYLYYLMMSIIVDQGPDVYNSFEETADENESESGLLDLLSLNPWTYETFEIITYGHSSVEKINRIEELETKVGNLIPSYIQDDFIKYRYFLDMVYQRSLTMGENVLNVLRRKNEPIAMIIGAAHTQDFTDYFNEKEVSYYVLEPNGLNALRIWSNLTTAEYKQKEEGRSIIGDDEIVSFFMVNRNLRPTLNLTEVKNQRDFYLLADRMIAIPQPLSYPIEYPDNFSFFSNGLRIIQDSVEIIDGNDILYRVENSNGDYLYVRIMDNSFDYRFGSLRHAFQEMIRRLSQISDSNMSIKEQAIAMSSIIEVVNIDNKLCVFGKSAETLRMLSIATL